MRPISLLARSLTPATGLFGAVLLVRLLALSRLSYSSFLLPGGGDMHFYNTWAQQILRGELTDHLAFYGLPGYAYLLAFLYRIGGYNPFVAGLLQAFLDASTAVLIYAISLEVFSSAERPRNFIWPGQPKLVGVAAGLAWAFFVPAEVYAVILMPTTWFIFVFWLVVWRIVRTETIPSWKECLVLGLLIGITATAVATILFLIPLVLAALLIKRKIDNRQRHRAVVVGAMLLLAGVGVGTSPCWIHNYVLARDPAFLSAHSGINLWIGNNPSANGYPRFPPGLHAGQAAMLLDSIAVAETAAGHVLKRSDVSAYWSGKAKTYIKDNLHAWLRLEGVKVRNFWNAFQYDDLSIITNLRAQRIVFPGLYFGVVAALALPGTILGWRLAPRSRWITAAILLHMAALLPVFITERYRLTVVPGLLVFAAFGLSIFWKSCVAGNYRRLAIYATMLVGSTIFVSWPQRSPSLWALDAYNSGWQALESNDLTLAEKKLGLAYAYVPGNAETNFALGNLRLARGNGDGAKSFYHATLTLDPHHKGALNNLGVIALDEERWHDAESFFIAALKQEPGNAKSHYLLAKAHLKQGDITAARMEIEAALTLKPDQPEFAELRETIRRP